MTYSTLLVEIAGGIATVTLNRPERLNCFQPCDGQRSFASSGASFEPTPTSAVVVLRAAPGRAFCSGVVT